MRTEMDYLVLGSHVLDKREQPVFEDSANWRKEQIWTDPRPTLSRSFP
ncbi:MAG: hypothetical protein U1G05_17750 [Kiritimatiellia bacterium]